MHGSVIFSILYNGIVNFKAWQNRHLILVDICFNNTSVPICRGLFLVLNKTQFKFVQLQDIF